MVNVTVVKGKDVIKYLVRITVVIILIFILSRYFSRFKEIKVATDLGKENENTLISCLEETIPQAKQVMKQELKEEDEIKEPVKTVLAKELGLMDAITPKDVQVQKLANEESSITIDNNNDTQDVINIIEDTRRSTKG
jgi:hypothetical protein